jgi:hypothetical protein
MRIKRQGRLNKAVFWRYPRANQRHALKNAAGATEARALAYGEACSWRCRRPTTLLKTAFADGWLTKRPFLGAGG